MLVSPPLRWMVPVAVVAAVLAPMAAAQLPGLGSLTPDPVSLIPSTPSAPTVDPAAAFQQASDLLQQWQEAHTIAGHQVPSPHAAPDSGQASDTYKQARAAADDAATQASNQAAGAQEQAGQQATGAQAAATTQAQDAQGQALQQVQAAQDEAGRVTSALPSDPVGFATGTAKGAADKATETIPTVLGDPATVQPASAGGQVVAPQTGLIPPILAGSILVAGAAGATFFAFWLAGSSGTVASGAVATKSSELRRLLPFASPLFTRFEKETVLGHPRREALYALILQQPGVSLQSLGEATGLSRTAVLHHLRLLEMQHLVVSKRMGRSRHYYENGGRYGRDAKEAYAILQNARSKEVAEFIRTHPGAMQKQLCEALAIQPSIAHWHVRRLQQAQLVECVRHGRAVNYFPGPGLLEVAARPALPAPEPEPAPLPMATVPSALPSA